MEMISSLFSFEGKFLFYMSVIIISFLIMLVFIFRLFIFLLRKKSKTEILAQFISLSMAAAISTLGIININFLISKDPVVISQYPLNNQALNSYDKPLVIEFDTPINTKEIITNVTPGISGIFEIESYTDKIPYGRRILFRPTKTIPEETKGMVYLANIRQPKRKDYGGEYLLSFTPPRLPNIISSNIKDRDLDVSPETEIVFNLDEKPIDGVLFNVESEPQFSFSQDLQPNKIAIRPDKKLMQNTKYSIKISRIPILRDLINEEIIEYKNPETVYNLSFTTTKPAFIKNFKPEGTNANPKDPVIITFDAPMNEESVEKSVSIYPETELYPKWNSTKTILTLTDKPLLKDTDYKITISKDANTLKGGAIENEISFNFKTLGPAKVIRTEPNKKNLTAPVTQKISVTFDQEVDNKSAELNFKITPMTKGKINWENNTMIFSSEGNLLNNTLYKFSLSKGIKSIYGLPSSEDYEFSFTTRANETTLPVKLIYQEQDFTCNIAALRMLLSYRSVVVTETEIIEKTGKSGSRGNGNPHIGFTQNYGTYWEPILKAANSWRPARLLENPSISQIIYEITNGNPVMVWGQNGWSDPHEISWTAEDGNYIYAINGMHSYIVRGFRGEAENPVSLVITDPWRGETVMSVNDFVRRLSYLKMGLVVE